MNPKTAYSILLSIITLLSMAAPSCAEKTPDVIFLRRAELMKQKPTRSVHGVRIWLMRKDERSRTALIELRGDLKRHLHPDARHSILVVEGEIWFQKGESKEETLLREGDYVSIGIGVPHKYRVKGERALIISFDAPAYDSAKTVDLPE